MKSMAAVKAELDALYAEVPHLPCKQKCASSCGPILMSYVEWQRIIKKLGYEPKAPPPNPLDPRTMNCPMLKGGLCSVYAMRPMICRLWGVVETMPCPWGCQPERMLTTREGYVLLQRAAILGAQNEEEREMEERVLAVILDAPEDVIAMSKALHIKPQKEGGA